MARSSDARPITFEEAKEAWDRSRDDRKLYNKNLAQGGYLRVPRKMLLSDYRRFDQNDTLPVEFDIAYIEYKAVVDQMRRRVQIIADNKFVVEEFSVQEGRNEQRRYRRPQEDGRRRHGVSPRPSTEVLALEARELPLPQQRRHQSPQARRQVGGSLMLDDDDGSILCGLLEGMRAFDDLDVEDRYEICYSDWDGIGGPSCFPTDPTLAEFLSLRASRKRRRR